MTESTGIASFTVKVSEEPPWLRKQRFDSSIGASTSSSDFLEGGGSKSTTDLPCRCDKVEGRFVDVVVVVVVVVKVEVEVEGGASTFTEEDEGEGERIPLELDESTAPADTTGMLALTVDMGKGTDEEL